MQPLDPEDLIIRPPAQQPQPAKPAGPQVSQTRFQELERVLLDTPLYVAPYIELAEIYLAARRWTDARRVLEKAVARFPDDARAEFLYEQSQLERSLELERLAEAEHAKAPSQITQDQLDRCRVELNVLKERIYRRRLERQPEQVELMIPLAEAMESLGHRDQAIDVLRQATAHPPLRSPAALALAKMLERAQRVPEALSAYRRAALFRAPPPDRTIQVEALRSAVQLARRNQLLDSARRYARMLIELEPGNAGYQQLLVDLGAQPL